MTDKHDLGGLAELDELLDSIGTKPSKAVRSAHLNPHIVEDAEALVEELALFDIEAKPRAVLQTMQAFKCLRCESKFRFIKRYELIKTMNGADVAFALSLDELKNNEAYKELPRAIKGTGVQEIIGCPDCIGAEL